MRIPNSSHRHFSHSTALAVDQNDSNLLTRRESDKLLGQGGSEILGRPEEFNEIVDHVNVEQEEQAQ